MNEKLISEFLSLGCKSRKDAVACLQVYLDLREVKKYWDIEYKFNNDLRIFYIRAKKNKSETDSIFIPQPIYDNLSFNKIKQYFNLCLSSGNKRIYLALVAADSTCVYYKLSEGLINPEELEVKRFTEDRHYLLESELRKNRKILESAALYSLPVTIPKKRVKEKEQQLQIQP